MEQTRRPHGRRSRGDRRMVLIPTSEAFYTRLVEEARGQGIGISEYICAELARHHGLVVPDYIQPALDVDIAAMPIVPAPMSRTFCDQMEEAKALADCPAAGVIAEVR